MHILRTLSTISLTWKNLQKQKAFLKDHIQPLINKAVNQNDGSLSVADIKKITHYYGLAVPAVLAESFCILHGRQLQLNERWTSTCQGAMTGLFDDFFDHDALDDSSIKNKIINTTVSESTKEKLFTNVYSLCLKYASDPKEIKNALIKVYHAQIESRKQTHQLEASEIKRITILKGGESLLFYRTAINEFLSAEEKQMLFSTGALMQLCNDIFDIYKDREASIHTLATDCADINQLKFIYETMLNDLIILIRKLQFPLRNKQQYFQMISLAVFSRTEVCLDHLMKSQKKYGKFDVHLLSRKELICDMDKLSGKVMNAWYAGKRRI